MDMRKLIELERELRRAQLLQRRADSSLRLSPRALHRLGEIVLKDILGAGQAMRGEPGMARAGSAGEPVGSSRPWQFGDAEPWDVARTLRNAVLRSTSTSDGAIALDIVDVEVQETEQRMRAAVALCVDVSWSVVQDGRWGTMKRTALALHQLITTRFRNDELQLIGFARYARSFEIGELVALDGIWEQGTNLHHALLLAGRHLRRHPDANTAIERSPVQYSAVGRPPVLQVCSSPISVKRARSRPVSG